MSYIYGGRGMSIAQLPFLQLGSCNVKLQAFHYNCEFRSELDKLERILIMVRRV